VPLRWIASEATQRIARDGAKPSCDSREGDAMSQGQGSKGVEEGDAVHQDAQVATRSDMPLKGSIDLDDGSRASSLLDWPASLDPLLAVESTPPMAALRRLLSFALRNWRAADGHKPSFPAGSKFVSLLTEEGQLSGDETEPLVGSTRPQAVVRAARKPRCQ
jgi:hypothetical protein